MFVNFINKKTQEEYIIDIEDICCVKTIQETTCIYFKQGAIVELIDYDKTIYSHFQKALKNS